jgi:hypothetical protein
MSQELEFPKTGPYEEWQKIAFDELFKGNFFALLV